MLFGNRAVVTAGRQPRAPRAGRVGVAGGLPGSADPVPARPGARTGRPPRRPASRCAAADPAAVRVGHAVPGKRVARRDGAAGLAGRPARADLAGAVAGQRRRAAGAAWRQLPAGWLHRRSGRLAQRLAVLSSALITAICADIVRPSLAGWSPAGEPRRAWPAAMAAARDPDGFARLRALCDGDPAVAGDRGTAARSAGPR